MTALRADYGADTKIELGNFEHTGILHEQDSTTFEIFTHQSHYVKELHAIDTALINMDDDDTPLSEAVRQVFWSLLGALAWLLQTRADIAPFVGFLQRNTHDPRIRHLRQINRVLAYCKRVSTGIRFKKLQLPLRLVCVADAAYQANQDLTECIALKGFLILLVGSDATDSKFPGGHCVCFDYISRKFATITRISFAAELLGKPLPPIEAFEIAAKKMNPMALSFWQENRRVSNRLLCEELGYSLLHPDYRSGLRDCMEQDSVK